MRTPNAGNWLPLKDAIAAALSKAASVTQTETIRLAEAAGRVLASDITSKLNVPPWHNSSMDGYAFCFGTLKTDTPTPIAMTVLAGHPAQAPLAKGSLARIMTGAPLPEGADTVVMQENCTRHADTAIINIMPSKAENVRERGCDIAVGDQIIPEGRRLEARHLMLLASIGMAEVPVFRKLRVGLIATGDELVAPGSECAPGQIYESNMAGLAALLTPLHVSLHNYGIVKDSREPLSEVFSHAADNMDLVISCGGVSVGDADLVKDVIAQSGEVNYWKVAIKPGKPFAFGTLGGALFCGVPGNPVSAYVTTQKLVIPVIRKMQGETLGPGKALTIDAILTHPYPRRSGREEFVRAQLSKNSGQWEITPLAKQSSGVMTSVTKANAYMIVPADSERLEAGSIVSAEPFNPFIAGDVREQ